MACSDIYDCMSITLEDTGEDNAGLIFYRSKSQPFFSKREKTLFGTLVPHLRRMVRMRRVFEERQIMQSFHTGALDRLPFGALLLDHVGMVRQSNPAAEAIFTSGDGLGLRQGRLFAVDAENDKRLKHAISWALGKVQASDSCGDLCIRRRSGKRAYVVQILPLTMESAEVYLLPPHSHGRGAIVVVTDPEQAYESSIDVLHKMFGLTATEALLVTEISAGKSIRELADARRVSEDTVRWHLKNAQEKTGTRRVAELVRLVSLASRRLAGPY